MSVGKCKPWQQWVMGDRAEFLAGGSGFASLSTTRQCSHCMGKLSSNTPCPKKSTRNETFSTITSLMEPKLTGKCYSSIIFLNFAIFIQPFLRLPEKVFQASNIQASWWRKADVCAHACVCAHVCTHMLTEKCQCLAFANDTTCYIYTTDQPLLERKSLSKSF